MVPENFVLPCTQKYIHKQSMPVMYVHYMHHMMSSCDTHVTLDHVTLIWHPPQAALFTARWLASSKLWQSCENEAVLSQDSFAEHARLQRRIVQKERQLEDIGRNQVLYSHISSVNKSSLSSPEKQHASRGLRRTVFLQGVCLVLIVSVPKNLLEVKLRNCWCICDSPWQTNT